MQDQGWTKDALEAMDEAEFFLRWWATFGGPPAAMLPRAEMAALILAARAPEGGEADDPAPGESALPALRRARSRP